MSNSRLEKKTFLLLVLLSVLFHLAVFELIALIPPDKEKVSQEPTMVDLTDLPPLPPQAIPKPQPFKPPENKRLAERRQRVTREIAPKGENETERLVPQRPRVTPPSRAAEVRPQTPGSPSQMAEPIRPAPEKSRPISRGEGIFKPKSGESTERPNLFPSAGKLARLEDSYRKKYGQEVEDGEAKFLNTDDIQFGSFLRRFETAVYGVWHYPQAALMRGIQGTTPVKITFNRSGEIVHVDLLDSSGSVILDEEVIRTLKQLGRIGSFPKGYTGEEFKLIAFFQYGISGGRLH